MGGVTTAQTGSPAAGAESGVFGAGLSGAFQTLAPQLSKLSPILRNRWNAVEQKVMDFMEQHGISLSTGQKTGSEAVQRLEKGLVNVPGAAGPAQDFFQNQEQQISKAGEHVLGQATPGNATIINPPGGGRLGISPGAPMNAVETGQSLIDKMQGKIQQAKDFADQRYNQVRSILQSDANKVVQEGKVGLVEHARPDGTVWIEFKKAPDVTFETPVDITDSKENLRSIYDELSKTMPEFQRQSSPGFAALKQIIDGPSTVDALTVDRNLGAVKALLRNGKVSSLLSTQSERLAAETVDSLTRDFNKAVGNAGALEKLNQGRKAVARYHDLDKMLTSLPKNSMGELEPAAVYAKFSGAGDKSAAMLRDFNQFAPKEMKQVGQTLLQGMLDNSASEGGVKGAQGLLAKWRNIGPETKKVLIGDKTTTDAIDLFLLGAKKLTENVNPSGTAKLQAALGPIGALIIAGTAGASASGGITEKATRFGEVLGAEAAGAVAARQLAKMLLVPKGAQLLTKALVIDPNSPGFSAVRTGLNAIYGQVLKDEPSNQ